MLGKWVNSICQEEYHSRLKTSRKTRSSRRKHTLSFKDHVSDFGESAAFHSAQTSLLDFGDVVKERNQDHAVVKDAETLSVTGNDTPRKRQEKEARTVGGIPPR